MFGHDVLAATNGHNTFTCHVFNCDDGQTSLKSFDVPKDPDATVTSLYNFTHGGVNYFVALMSRSGSDSVVVYQIADGQAKQLHAHDTKSKVQRLALGSSLHHSGYFDDSCASENSAYTNTVQ
jgi:hypothetical protein